MDGYREVTLSREWILTAVASIYVKTHNKGYLLLHYMIYIMHNHSHNQLGVIVMYVHSYHLTYLVLMCTVH